MAVVVCQGCATSALDDISVVYYFWGPEETLSYIESAEVEPQDRVLVELERAVALLELGQYEASREVLGDAAAALASEHFSAAGLSSDPVPAAWRPELHERVLIHTLRMANSLAMQDPGGAAEAADDAIAVLRSHRCVNCRFDFTRVLGAIAFEAAGRYSDGAAVLRDLQTTEESKYFVSELAARIERGVVGAQPAGLAPPPEGGERTLVVILLLGRGPYKVKTEISMDGSKPVPWLRYLPRDPQVVTGASLHGADPVDSVELTDVTELAVASLEERRTRLRADPGTQAVDVPVDLRHWSALPASLEMIRFPVGAEVPSVDLVYSSPVGEEIDRETISLPEGWFRGTLFVTRRMP
jgi:hypothetical protein